tara:strand:- start:83 stop:232 length:150 start_codon:yes stop_codon:yes gene_type:complete
MYAYRDGLIDYGTQLLQRINDEVNSASEEDDWLKNRETNLFYNFKTFEV